MNYPLAEMSVRDVTKALKKQMADMPDVRCYIEVPKKKSTK